ncbi:MAG TPA: AAA-like domain-containing protein, partial [Allocoleopsis sp.]
IVLEEPEGLVSVDSKFYIERSPLETDCYERIVRPGSLIRIKAPGHMGKSSLMARILNYAKQQGYQTAKVNFRLVDTEFWTSLDQFLQWFCASVTDAMELPDKLGDYWKGVLGSKNKSMKYFERYLLAQCDKPLVLGLDNVDKIFPHEEIAVGFLGLLRTWHEQGKNEEIWKKLRLTIAHSKEVYIPLSMDQSPFNVGFAAELRQFNQTEVQDLVQRHGLDWTEEQVRQLMQIVGGHPYLLRVALYQIARQRMSMAELLQVAPTEEGLYREHLRHHYLNLKSDEKLVATLRQVVSANEPIQVGTEEAFKLQSMGLVKYQGNAIAPSCELYRRYFRDRL